jgi:hypothetical protein
MEWIHCPRVAANAAAEVSKYLPPAASVDEMLEEEGGRSRVTPGDAAPGL